ncbi:hypothetical protein ACH4RA_10910 [Streptomyces smyrnaeus]|uniref:hypothetical protein n=1 Tax=Streptomyces smyrnaeus TaxID=1387713 RepID=UPI0033E7AAAB
MHQPQERSSRLRVVTLASTVALAVALPLAAAVAGQDARLAAEAFQAAQPRHSDDHARRVHDSQSQESGGHDSGGHETGGHETGTRSPGSDSWAGHPSERSPSGSQTSEDRPGGRGHPASSCGLEIVSPEGVAARACVLTEGGDTWARAYYRNPTGGRLPVVLTLHGPDGSLARAHCTLRGDGDPGVCETPRGRSAKATADKDTYMAVADVSSADGRRVLRAESDRRRR